MSSLFCSRSIKAAFRYASKTFLCRFYSCLRTDLYQFICPFSVTSLHGNVIDEQLPLVQRILGLIRGTATSQTWLTSRYDRRFIRHTYVPDCPSVIMSISSTELSPFFLIICPENYLERILRWFQFGLTYEGHWEERQDARTFILPIDITQLSDFYFI